MAASLYKWLIVPLGAILLISFRPKPHPFHVSVTEINHNVSEKSLEISCKIYTDDFEKILAKNYKTKVDLGKAEMKTAMDSLVKKYILSHLSVKPDGRAIVYTYIGFEIESEACYAYVEVSNVSSVTNLAVSNSILYDEFDDQMNIIHVTVGGKRKSNKVNYPEKELLFSFN